MCLCRRNGRRIYTLLESHLDALCHDCQGILIQSPCKAPYVRFSVANWVLEADWFTQDCEWKGQVCNMCIVCNEQHFPCSCFGVPVIEEKIWLSSGHGEDEDRESSLVQTHVAPSTSHSLYIVFLLKILYSSAWRFCVSGLNSDWRIQTSQCSWNKL